MVLSGINLSQTALPANQLNDEGTMELWNKKGVPHKDWICVDCEDLGEPEGECFMCGRNDVRYLHHMQHEDYEGTIAVGCVCASKMEQNSKAARKREQAMQNLGKRRKTFLRRSWRVSERGNEYLNIKGVNVGVFRSGPGFKFRIEGQFSATSYADSNQAKLALFDAMNK